MIFTLSVVVKSARQPRLRPPPPPCSHAFLDVSISLMSQWFYGRTAGLERKCLTAASPTPTPSRLPSVSGCFHLIDVPMAIWQDWISKKMPDSHFSDTHPLPVPSVSGGLIDVSKALWQDWIS
ncbi:uncharacterized protein LOC128237705 [Mya arenaria]|uniref:uncharacterized protein LOC128237705 n=1 Tax=Mya arenaria TaxID=6604 RepID=UPI0022E8DC87|nr:uncharacterized protein LOC128237705 [Mya arenaria]